MDVVERINQATWATKFEIMPGIFTPGVLPVNPKVFLDRYKETADLSGKTVLDIGAFDGAVVFEAERRGAKAHAMDIQDPDKTAFNTAKSILNSEVEYQQGTVYDLESMYGADFFDVVFFKGVYYHLKDPLRAFEAVSKVLKPQGFAIIAGELLVSHGEDLSGNLVDVSEMAQSDVPITLCYPGHLPSDPRTTTWFVPNLACMKSWLKGTGLVLIDHSIIHDPNIVPRPIQRFVGLVHNSGQAVVEHPVMERGWTNGKEQRFRKPDKE